MCHDNTLAEMDRANLAEAKLASLEAEIARLREQVAELKSALGSEDSK